MYNGEFLEFAAEQCQGFLQEVADEADLVRAVRAQGPRFLRLQGEGTTRRPGLRGGQHPRVSGPGERGEDGPGHLHRRGKHVQAAEVAVRDEHGGGDSHPLPPGRDAVHGRKRRHERRHDQHLHDERHADPVPADELPRPLYLSVN
ncbi:hypothetical protein HPB48_002364 [Haemaphysalis longicornis]|uniref:Uncharacterized protein n=1 Tax=Haemaphysalis longicornis TaxID=44386 RepID=A0A9J6GFJ3_HAELO|nr:hypothetical protein HPB48_002364 [Haemaphysalis longicornis]